MLLVSLSSFIAFAEDGENGGANKAAPLTVEAFTITGGESQASLTPTIFLTFNKNVVNAAVKENNRGCFAVTDETGKAIAIQVVFPDDQVDPTQKRNVYINATGSLNPAISYTLTISDKIQAKSGSMMTESFSRSFKTQGEKAGNAPVDKPTVALTEKTEPVSAVDKETKTPKEQMDTTPKGIDEGTTKDEETTKKAVQSKKILEVEKEPVNLIKAGSILLIVMAILLLAVYFIWRKKLYRNK